MSFLFVNKTSRLNNPKTRPAMNVKISVFVICVEAIIYLLLYNLHECTFNSWHHNYETSMKMCWETVNVPTKCSSNLWVIKVNNNLEITSVCSMLYLCNKTWIRKPVIHKLIFSLFCSHAMSSNKETLNIAEFFHFKTSRLGFTFLPPVNFEIIKCRFS